MSAAGRTSRHVSGTAIATVATCGYVGFLVGPAALGFAADALSLRIALGIVVLLSLCAAAFASVVGIKQAEGGPLLQTSEPAEASLRENE